MKYLRQLKNLTGKRVLMRVDFNVGFGHDGIIAEEDAIKIEKTLPTIKFLIGKNAKIILMAHLGHPKGQIKEDLRLNGVADYVSKILKKKINKLDEIIGPNVEAAVKKMKNKEIILLENIRFDPREEKNDKNFAKGLAKFGDIYVNEAFAVSHRNAASVSAVTKYLPSYAGLLLEKEIKALSCFLKKLKKPVVIIFGGLKFETKLPVIKRLLPKADYALLGGGISNTVFAALDYGVGASKIGREYFSEAKKVGVNRKVRLPLDVVVGEINGKDYFRVLVPKEKINLCGANYGIYDIGPATIRAWSVFIKKANTIIWNGPVGYFEKAPFDKGSASVAYLVGARSKGKAYGVVGGGETLSVLTRSKMIQYIDHVSTGGGAMLEFLSGKKLPGIVALK